MSRCAWQRARLAARFGVPSIGPGPPNWDDAQLGYGVAQLENSDSTLSRMVLHISSRSEWRLTEAAPRQNRTSSGPRDPDVAHSAR